MSRIDLWTRAATAMYDDPDPRWQAVAAWLRTEALAQDGMEPFADLLNVMYEEKTGVKGILRFGRNASGDLSFLADTNEGATAVAQAYLNAQPEARP